MAHTHIPHLPNEILCEIASYVNEEDIPNLRLSAKVFRSITADRFATTFFENRAYALSDKGLEKLIEITKHPIFASHIRTVIIGHGGKHCSAKYHNKLKRAFQNLATIGNTISLGLRHMHTPLHYDKYSHAISDPMMKFFEEKMMAAVDYSQMPLKNLVVDLQKPPGFPRRWEQGFWHRFSTGVAGYNQFGALQIKLDWQD